MLTVDLFRWGDIEKDVVLWKSGCCFYGVLMTVVKIQMRSAVRKSSASNEGEQGEEASESITNELAPATSLTAVQPSAHRIGMVVDMAESNWIGGFLPGQFCLFNFVTFLWSAFF